MPGFVDAHAHLAMTGFALHSLDLSSEDSLIEALDALAGASRSHAGPLVYAHGWDETRWPEGRPPTMAEVDRAVGDRPTYVLRLDSHSAIVSSALVDRCPGLDQADGWRGAGLVERDAHHLVRAALDRLRTPDDRRQAIVAALREAAAHGITSVHELNAPHIAPATDFATIREIADDMVVPEVVPYWGALIHEGSAGPDDEEMGGPVVGYAGDLCMDGAIGSRTAALSAVYADADTSGHLYLDRSQVADHVIACTLNGKQAGFHVIGDRAAREVVAGFTGAADVVGEDAMVRSRHRLEHVEMLDDEEIASMARLGIVASVQPAFDAAWGSPGQLYERRLGSRAVSMNAYGRMHRAGVTLAFGSDTPVTPLDPWGAVRASVWHHCPQERMSVQSAVDAHTRGGHRARRDDDAGVLRPGSPATYAIWDTDHLSAGRVVPGPASTSWAGGTHAPALPDVSPATALPHCVRTVIAGATAFSTEED
jgi:predicted amidohydrolase YtcJ